MSRSVWWGPPITIPRCKCFLPGRRANATQASSRGHFNASDPRSLYMSWCPLQVERGHTRTRQAQGGVGRGLYGLLTAPITLPSRGWEAITEAEIGQDWVQFLIDETDKGQ